MEIKRATAVKVRIGDLVEGKFFKQEDLIPSYVLTRWGQKVSRANILGTVTDKFVSDDGSYGSITVDDGTGVIRCKVFKEDVKLIEKIDVGDRVVVIGRIREYAEEIYINLEAVEKINNPNYELLRALEVLDVISKRKKLLEDIKNSVGKFADLEEMKTYMKKTLNLSDEEIESIVETLELEEEFERKDYKPLILEIIDRLDEGDGVEISKILKESNLPKNVVEEIVTELLESGLCYEPKPGVIKKV
ncbi:MAG: hypothetical protein J7K98_03440 [Candidatus Aenigmarchaeota archaeon]|nr:hypothetical protein [Candidatus Aenigmarchaeota archaeon]